MKRGIIPILVVLLISLSLNGENISEKIRLNGFLSQGFVYSTDNDFLPNSSKSGSSEMSEFGATFSVDVTEKLRLGFQLFARDFGPIGNHNIKLDWGFADYRFADAFGIRVGKVKTPVGLYNEVRDTDALHPLAILPQSIYDETMRAVFVAYEGLGIYGNLDFKGFGDFDYHVFGGSIYHPEDAPHLWQIQFAANVVLSQLGMMMTQIGMESEYFYGGRLIWNTPIRGFRLGGTLIRHKSAMEAVLDSPLTGPFPVYGSMELTRCFFLSGEFTLGDFTLTSEYMELLPEIQMEMFGQTAAVSEENMQGWYVMASYMFGDKVTLTALYDQFYADKDDKKGLGAIAQGNPDFVHWQKDLAFGLRYDINFNWTIKFEWHKIDGLGKSWIFSDRSTYERYWNMFVTKISFNF